MATGRDDPLTIACRDADFRDWRCGRSHAVAWVLDLDRRDVHELVSKARGRLGDYLLPRYQRQPHVTLAFGGLLPEGDPRHDDYTPEHLAEDLDVLRELAEGPVTLRATGWDTFPMVPFLALEHPWLRRAHDALTAHAPESHHMDFRPHVTIGHYRGTWPLSEPLRLLEDLTTDGAWPVEDVRLVRFRAADIAGPLETVGRLELATGRWLPGEC